MKPKQDFISKYQAAVALLDTNPKCAFNEFSELACHGYPAGMFRLGWCYQHGKGTAVDNQLAKSWYNKADEVGDEDIKNQVRENLLELRFDQAYENQEEAPERAFKEFKLLSEESYAPAMLQLAWCYHKGTGARADPVLAEKWYRCAHEAGGDYEKKEAEQFLLKLRFDQAYEILEEAPERAFEEFKLLSEESYAPAMLQLAWCYHRGAGARADLTLAEKWYRRAYEKGGDYEKKEAEKYLLKLRHDQAYGIRKEAPERAFKEFKLLSENGYAQSMLQLAWCYHKGIGIAKDLEQGEEWYRQAFKNGSAHVKGEAEKYLNYLKFDRGLDDSVIRRMLVRIFGSSRTYWLLRILGAVLLVIYYSKPRGLDFSIFWTFVFLFISVSGGYLGAKIIEMKLWPSLDSMLTRPSMKSGNQKIEDEINDDRLRGLLRAMPFMIFVPLEDALFCIPVLLQGASPWFVILSGLIFGVAHLGGFTYGECITKSVFYTIAMFIVLPHGLLTMMAGHFITDVTLMPVLAVYHFKTNK